jgi:uncharacterized protein
MQRYSFGLLLLVTLYVSACTPATRVKQILVQEEATRDKVTVTAATPIDTVPEKVSEPEITAISPSTIGTSELPPVKPPLPPAVNFAPHIAIILPLKSTSFAAASNAVQQGFMAAANAQKNEYPVRIYSSTDENKEIIDLYRQAIANGAVAIAGPLTRAGASLLAAYTEIAVPTLILNTSEQKAASNKFYFFSLSPEAEARQVAQIAYAAKLHDATTINTGTPLTKRLTAAFVDEWKKLGGNINAEVTFKENDNTSILTNLPTAPWLTEPLPQTIVNAAGEIVAPKRIGPLPAAPGNVVFLAAENRQARLIRPYLNPSLPIFASSQLFNVESDTLTNFDLNEIRFVDMPWLLQPDHPAVMIYPRAETVQDTEKERLYGFGIDAYRLINILITGQFKKALPLDGVTGRIRLSETNLFTREATPAVFKYGRGLTPEGIAALEAERAAAKAAENAARRATSVEGSSPAVPAR